MKDWAMGFGILVLTVLSITILKSIAPHLFPLYFLYTIFAVLGFVVFSKIDFEILSIFHKHFYVASIIFLVLPLLIGQVTRGAVRWIPIGPLTLQPAEITRPFLTLFFAVFLTEKEVNLKRLMLSFFYLGVPLILILVQPSLGMTILTMVGFVGILIATGLDKKLLIGLFILGVALIPVTAFFLAPYQKQRISAFLNPAEDYSGAGYNSLQSMIAVGSGKLTGRGLGQGVQTQLAFLPEKHTDFIFASVAEELGFIGASLLLIFLFFLLYRIIVSLENSYNRAARAFLAGIFLSFFIQILVHIGMNMGLFPITGIPLPLISAGGSSLLSTMISLGMVIGARRF